MAVPQNPRVEANSITTTVVRWDTNALFVEVYRSPDGAVYAFVGGSAAGISEFQDSGLDVGTKYWYKLSEDGGLTFSSVVTVYTHSCVGSVSSANRPVTLPRFSDDEVAGLIADTSQVPGFSTNLSETTQRMNELAERVEKAFLEKPPQTVTEACEVCPVDGAVVIDCSTGCNNWEVVTEDGADVNSVSISWCNKFDGTIDFIVPPNATVGVCGFPAGFGFSGDECKYAKIKGGANGRRFRVGFSSGSASGASGGAGSSTPGDQGKPGKSPGSGASGGASGGGGGGAGCTCVPSRDGRLTLKLCNNNNSLGCNGSKSLKVIACGGRGPYTFSKTGSVSISPSADGNSATVSPPANPGSGTGGTAYSKAVVGVGCGHTVGTIHGAGVTAGAYGCNDQLILCPAGVSAATTVGIFADSACGCGPHSGHAISGGGGVTTVDCASVYGSGAECQATADIGAVTDLRTGPMIAAGCVPCALSAGSTVSVTDSTGTVFTSILKA